MADTEFRRKLLSLNFAKVETGAGREKRPDQVRPMRDPSWENGQVGERRVDGSFMPYLVPGTDRPMQVHERTEHSQAIRDFEAKRAAGVPHSTPTRK